MRKSLRWTLAAALALTAWALWRGEAPAPAVVEPTRLPEAASPVARLPGAPVPALPGDLPPLDVEEAKRDIFALLPDPVPPPPPPPPKLEPPPPLPVVVPPPPAAPPMVWRFLGRMRTPEGRTLVLLSRPDAEVPAAVEAGTILGDGYVIKAVSAEAIQLSHPPTGTDVILPIPAPGS